MVDVPVPVNEAVLGYAPGSKERAGIESALERMAGDDPIELTATINGVSKPASGDAFDVEVVVTHLDEAQATDDVIHRYAASKRFLDRDIEIAIGMAIGPGFESDLH